MITTTVLVSLELYNQIFQFCIENQIYNKGLD